ncbi:hypothetical protein EfmAA242_13090 [Enterococcus faecium]|nr:hypothetical protein EfmAA242_13090 [Enterococcus faecium]
MKRFTEIIGEKAKEHKYTVMMGRTHGVHAEPTTFGLKLATWYSEMKRNMRRTWRRKNFCMKEKPKKYILLLMRT